MVTSLVRDEVAEVVAVEGGDDNEVRHGQGKDERQAGGHQSGVDAVERAEHGEHGEHGEHRRRPTLSAGTVRHVSTGSDIGSCA
jgi:hypothetical protein